MAGLAYPIHLAQEEWGVNCIRIHCRLQVGVGANSVFLTFKTIEATEREHIPLSADVSI